MAWAEPLYKGRPEIINGAGKVLVRSAEEDWERWTDYQWAEYYSAIDVINNWRSSHGYPLNTFQVNLRNVAHRFDEKALIAQRIKRLSSIRLKLYRFRSMKLSQMQDLGGCRGIFRQVGSVAKVVSYYTKLSAIKHHLASVDDYIAEPKASGYRGAHMVYRYFSDKAKTAYNGLKIEMQLRSQYQHAWATAVETVGMFSGQALKSSLGDDDWKRFFSLMGSAIAVRERSPLVPGTPTSLTDLRGEIAEYAGRLKVAERLSGYAQAMHAITGSYSNAHYFLLQLDPKLGQLAVTGFKRTEASEAEARYAEAEQLTKDKAGTDAVLVSVESVNALSKAYPNYFADTRLLSELMSQTIEGRSRRIHIPALSQGELDS